MWKRSSGSCAAPTRAPDTLYFGGGTPALLTPAQAAELIAAAGPRPGAEITLEANPDAVTPETLAGFRAAGVTRLSFGVQSARDSQLRTLGRLHTAAGAARALAWAREAGFPELCGDIMLALPGYTRAEFDETLALLAEGGCTHISAYLLKIEPGTAFAAGPRPACPTRTRPPIFTYTRLIGWKPPGTASTRSATLPAPATKGATTCCTGTAWITRASARRPTAAWAGCAGSGPATPPVLLPARRGKRRRAAATPRIFC